MSKKVVQYSNVAFWSAASPVGNRANVWPVDHPDTYNVTNGQMATTSEVVAYDETTGQFETQNTLYVPEGSLA